MDLEWFSASGGSKARASVSGATASEAVQQLFSYARHPSFNSNLARNLVVRFSEDELAEAWRHSRVERLDVTPLRRELATAVLRGGLLDEMEARSPETFPAWLACQELGRHRPPFLRRVTASRLLRRRSRS